MIEEELIGGLQIVNGA